jgi:photosynthetic reaction center cytochrome c subunit
MKIGIILSIAVAALLTAAMFLTAGWGRPPVNSVQLGYRGVGMQQIVNPREAARVQSINVSPPPADPAPQGGPLATSEYKNNKVLTDVSTDEFNRLMLSITEWVSPEQGCAYCHNVENLADDSLYTKVVARRMLQMVRHINGDWKTHVAGPGPGVTGVTCYTCHRGQPVPANIWFNDSGAYHGAGIVGNKTGVGLASPSVGLTSLPYNPFAALVDKANSIRVQATTALPENPGSSIIKTETTYGLMIHMSEALGVNCTFCHNSRAFSQWSQSSPQRNTAWYGIRMVRDLNSNFLEPLKATYPAKRLGPGGDAPKLNCATCHNGVNKPLYGVSLLKDYPELAGAQPASQ